MIPARLQGPVVCHLITDSLQKRIVAYIDNERGIQKSKIENEKEPYICFIFQLGIRR